MWRNACSREQVVVDPLPGVRWAFVVAGGDQRGTICGAYDVAKQIGVSPWYWWDDVPVLRLPPCTCCQAGALRPRPR